MKPRLKFAVFEDGNFKKEIIPKEPPICPLVNSKDSYYLFKEYYICFILFGAKIEMLIPKGFIFDGASIPRFFWRIVGHPFNPKIVIAALVHDVLFKEMDGRVKVWIGGYLVDIEKAMKFFDRYKSDQVFNGLLKACKNSPFIIFSMYGSVRAAGFMSFRKKKIAFYKDSSK